MKFRRIFLLLIILVAASSCCSTLNSSLFENIRSQKYKKNTNVDSSLCLPKPLYKKIVYIPIRILQWPFYGIGIVSVGTAAFLYSLNNSDDDDDPEQYDKDDSEDEDENYPQPLKLLGVGLLSFFIGSSFDYCANWLLVPSPQITEHQIKYDPESDQNNKND